MQPSNREARLRKLPWLGPALAAASARYHRSADVRQIVVFYDGECGVCDGFVRLLLRAGLPPGLRFATQQGTAWKTLVEGAPFLGKVDTVTVLTEGPGEDIIRIRSEAALWTLSQLRFPYAFGWLLMLIPMPLLDVGYRLVAAHRKRISAAFQLKACPVPPPEYREHFLD